MSQKKIALVGFRLSGGGSGRVLANLSNYFNEQGIDVHVIIFYDEIGYDFSGILFNLGKFKSTRNTIFNKIKRFLTLKKYIKQQDFDFIIDFRFRKGILKEFLISRFVYSRKRTIYTIHSSKLEFYMPKSEFWTNVIYGGSFRLMALTKEMEHTIKLKYSKLKNVSTIPNPINIDEIVNKAKDEINLNFEYVIGAGSYDVNIKQFNKLINAYSKSNLPKKNIHLVILGKGKLLEYLQKVAKENKVNNFVHFLGYQSNPYKYFSKAKYFVLSSEFEGLPMVLLEALACSIPVVAFNCPTGPEEVIIHGENGLLIENQNIKALTEGINTMMFDAKLYETCKANAFKTAQRFSVEAIGKQWLKLLNSINTK